MGQEYVCGFVRAKGPSGQDGVLLLRKNRPTWQVGKLNGTGGKVSVHEDVLTAMKREWREESQTDMLPEWQKFAHLTFINGCSVHFYKAEGVWEELRALDGLPNDVGEIFTFLEIEAALQNPDLIPNLRWLLSLAFLDTTDQIVRCEELDRGKP